MSEPRVRLLGAVAVHRPDGAWAVPARLDALVLAHLVLAEGRTLTVDDLIDAVWGDDTPDQARNALQVKVSRLRALLGENAAALTFSSGGYRLKLAEGSTDAALFEAGLRSGQQLLRTDPAGAARRLEAALSHWGGAPLADLGDHPRLVAARTRLEELQRFAREARAEALLADVGTRAHGIAELRSILETDPLRPRARVLLMEGLERVGRRAEALAVYDAGRRLHAHVAGLEPPEEVRLVFERLLAAERESTRRAGAKAADAGPPEGLAETARWVAEDGDVDAALSLALRGTWWWWLSGQRSLGRDLLADLVEQGRAGGRPIEGRAVLNARAWVAVYESLGLDARAALERGRRTLELVGRPSWNRHDCLAATLVAERLFERGELAPARRLLALAGREQQRRGDEWGQAFCSVVAARGALRAGDPVRARASAQAQLRRFLALGDLAGQVTCLDVIGYCAEVTGDLETATAVHTRAVALAHRAGAPEWGVLQLTRLGNVATLAERPGALEDLGSTLDQISVLGADSVAAYCHNGLGVAHAYAADLEAAETHHRAALAWYDAVGSTSGVAYTQARLAMVTGAPELAASSITASVRSGDPRAIAHSLEAVSITTEDANRAARALGAAHTLRAAASDCLAPPQLGVLDRRRGHLIAAMGEPAFRKHSHEGAEQLMAGAARW